MAQGDPLETLATTVDFEMFWPVPDGALAADLVEKHQPADFGIHWYRKLDARFKPRNNTFGASGSDS